MDSERTGIVRAVTAPKLLTMQDIADELGLGYRTVRNYHQVAERHRRDGGVRPGDFPLPDQVFGRSPVWKASTIKTWVANRPGRGVGGGRPPGPRSAPTSVAPADETSDEPDPST